MCTFKKISAPLARALNRRQTELCVWPLFVVIVSAWCLMSESSLQESEEAVNCPTALLLAPGSGSGLSCEQCSRSEHTGVVVCGIEKVIKRDLWYSKT